MIAKRIVLAFLVAATLSLMSLLPLGMLLPNASAYTPHAPIFINGNGDFTAANGVTGGSGTPSDPYVIDGWEIDASTAHGIDIRNADAHFIIRGVYVHSGGLDFDGISFLYVINARVESIESSGNHLGILMYHSSNNTITASNVSGNRYGIQMSSCANITVTANSIFFNSVQGLVIGDTTNATVTANTFIHDGIFIGGTPGSGWLSFHNTHTITTDNTVNGKPIYYHKDCTGLQVAGIPIGQLLVANCTGVVVSNVTVTDTDTGIMMFLAEDVLIRNSTVSSNQQGGVWIVYSDGVVVTASNMSLNKAHGFTALYSGNVTLVSNDIELNGDHGIFFLYSGNSRVYHNDIISNRYQAYDLLRPENSYDDGYPSGGNYWSDYNGTDSFSGPNQNLPGSDGIGDTPYVIDADSVDHYPLMNPHIARDKIPPVVEITSPTDGSVFRSLPVMVSGIASDAGGSALNRVELNVNGAGWMTATGTSSWSRLVNLGMGGNLIEARAWDNAGNPSATDSVSVLYTTAPFAVFTVTPISGNVTTAFAVDASSCFDEQTPPGLLEVRWDWEDNGTWDTSWSTTKTGQHQYAALGNYTIRLQVRDTDILTNDTTRKVWVNNTPPVAIIIFPPPPINPPPYSAYVEASLSTDLEDPVDALSVRWDWEDDGVWDTAWSTWKSADHQYPGPGTYTIRLEVRDTGGLVSTVTRQVTLIDDTPPEIEHISPDGFLVNVAITITAHVTDDSGVRDVYLHYKPVGASSFTMVRMNKTTGDTYEATIPAQAQSGTVYYYINATDKWGNGARHPQTGEHSLKTAEEENPPLTDPTVILVISVAVIAVIMVAAFVVPILLKRRKAKEGGKPPEP